MVLEIVTLLLACGYFITVLWFLKGWKSLSNNRKRPNNTPIESVGISLIIPFRNEQENLPFLVQSIRNLKVEGLNLEVIWIDDHSEDDGYSWIIEQSLAHPNWKVLQTSAGAFGKKTAISLGIQASSHPWIVCTDADCTFGPYWLQAMVKTALITQADFVSGPVKLVGTSWFQRLQALEFMSLNAIGGACLEKKHPVIANGANLMYKKSCWEKVGGFQPHLLRASGDDDLFLHQLSEAGVQTVFCLNQEAIVETEACTKLSEFVHQRLRWISKSGSYTRKDITIILAMVWLYLAGVLALLIQCQWLWAMSLWMVKWIMDSVFLWSPSLFYGLRQDWKWLWVVQFFYLPYVLIAGLAGNFTGYQWKGRKHR